MKLSKNFTLNELLKSNTAEVLGYTEQYNPPDHVVNNLRLLCENVIQPLRDAFGAAITVNSGYRCNRVNKAIGGVATSQHKSGQAADITCSDNQKLLNLLRSLDLPVDQCIVEFRKQNGQPSWIHVSFDPYRKRGQYLEAYKLNGKTKYRNSI